MITFTVTANLPFQNYYSVTMCFTDLKYKMQVLTLSLLFVSHPNNGVHYASEIDAELNVILNLPGLYQFTESSI